MPAALYGDFGQVQSSIHSTAIAAAVTLGDRTTEDLSIAPLNFYPQLVTPAALAIAATTAPPETAPSSRSGCLDSAAVSPRPRRDWQSQKSWQC